MGELDVAAKVLLHEVPEDLMSLVLPGPAVRSVRAAETTLPAVSLTMDKLLQVEFVDSDDPVTQHVEVVANWASNVPRRTFEYWSLAHRAHDDLLSVVLCLKPGSKQGKPVGVYERKVRGKKPLRFEFDVYCLWQIDADPVLAGGKLGLLPLVPYMRGSSPAKVEQALTKLNDVEPVRRRGELQAALVAFADNVFPDVDWSAKIPLEILMGSTVYQRGQAAGELVGQRKLLAVQMEERLGAEAQPLLPRLELATADVLTQVGKLLAGKHSDEELARALDAALPPASVEPETT